MQISGKHIKIPLMNTMLEKNIEKHKLEKTPFHASLLGNGLNIF